MPLWALIINPDPNMLALLTGAVNSVLRDTPCVTAENLARAKAQIKERKIDACRLIVCSPTAPEDSGQAPSLAARDLHGVNFVRELREQLADKPPVIFPLAVNDAERVAEIGALSNARCIGMADIWQNLPREIGNLVLGKNNPAQNHIDVDIFLRAGQECRWTMHGTEDNPLDEYEAIDISPGEIEQLMDLSGPAAAGNEAYLRRLGVIVYGMLMNPVKSSLEKRLEESVKPLGGMEFARIRFNVDEKTHCILLETLTKPDKDTSKPPFWMMTTPMFRKLGSPGARYPLFQNPRTQNNRVNCLLIQGRSDSFPVAGAFNRTFTGVPNAKQEIEWLEQYLTDNQDDFGIGTVEVLRYGEKPGSFSAQIEEALIRRQFELVHYAGHSAVDKQGEAWLVLGSEDDDQLGLAAFSRWAREVQFAFLSSCESANSQFIMQLVKREVPAVIGYAWPVLDSVALEFAETFYKKLLGSGRERRLLEYSFMAGKQALHRKWPENAHWAAPLLFMQVFEKQRDLRSPTMPFNGA